MGARSLIVFAFLSASSVVAQEDWPTADTPKLEERALGITVAIPAPEWIGESAASRGVANEDGIESTWFVPGGLDARANSVDIDIEPIDENWSSSARAHAYNYDASICETSERPKPPRLAKVRVYLVLCGRDFGTGRGVILFAWSRRVTEALAVDVWYKWDVPAFYANDETTWPMTPDALTAMAGRLTDGIVVTGP